MYSASTVTCWQADMLSVAYILCSINEYIYFFVSYQQPCIFKCNLAPNVVVLFIMRMRYTIFFIKTTFDSVHLHAALCNTNIYYTINVMLSEYLYTLDV